MVLGDLLVRIGADVATFEALKGNLNKASESIEAFAHKTEKLAIILEANLTLPLERAGEKLLETGEAFKDAMNEIIRGSGAAGHELEGLEENFKSVFSQVDASAKDVGSTLATFTARLGLSGEELENLTLQVESLADVTGEQMIPLAKSAASVFAGWNVEAEDMADSLDHFMNVAMASNQSTKGLLDLVAQVGPAFRSLGVSLEDTTDLIGNLAKSGVAVEPVLMGMQKALNTMSKAGLKDPLEGLQLLTDRIRDAKTTGEAFQIGATAFGKGAATLVNAIREGKFSLESFAGSLEIGNRKVNETADQMETLGQKLGLVKNQISLALQPMGEALISVFERLLVASKPLLEWLKAMGEGFANLPKPVQDLIVCIGLTAAALGPLAGIIGGTAAALSQLEIPLAMLSGLLGGPSGLVVVIGLFAAGVAAWAIYEAVTKINALNNSIEQLDGHLKNGGGATEDQAAKIAYLRTEVEKYNKSLDTKNKLDANQIDVHGNVMSVEDYIDKLETQFDKIKAVTKATSDYSTAITSVNGAGVAWARVTKEVEGTGKATDNAGKKTNQYSSNALAGYAKLMEAFGAYKAAQEELSKLQEAAGSKSLDIIRLQIADLRRQVFAPTETDKDNARLLYFEEIVKLNQKANIQVADDTLKAMGDLQQKLKLIGMNTNQAFKLLGVTSAGDLADEVEQVKTALERIKASKLATEEDIARATIAAREKEIAAWRAAGQEIEDELIDEAERLKAIWQANHMDVGQAGQVLGFPSEGQISNQLSILDAALKKIRGSVEEGTRTQLDADNAEIASLQKKASEFSSIGRRMTDEDIARLNELQAARRAATMTTADAYRVLGLPTPAETEAALEELRQATAKALADIGDDEETARKANLTALQKEIQVRRQAGETITSDMLNEFHKQTVAAQIAALDIEQAFKGLNVVSTREAVGQLQLLEAEFKKIDEDATSSAEDRANALIARLAGTIDLLRKQGKVASDEMVRQLEDLRAKQTVALMNIEDAYKTLGLTSTQQIVNAANQASAALAKIEADQKASAFDRLQAELAANDAIFKAKVATGQAVDQLQSAQNALAKKRLQEALSDANNAYTAFLGVVEQSYGALQTALSDVIMNTKSVGDAFLAMAKTIEKALVDYVVKNLILTNANLRSLEGGILDFFKGMTGIGAGVAKAGTQSGVDLALQGATGVTQEIGSTAKAVSGGGLLSSFGSIVSVVGAVADVVNGIISYLQNKRMEGTLNAIEQHTKVMAIAMTGISAPWEKVAEGTTSMSGQLQDIRNFLADIDQWTSGLFQADMMEIMMKLDTVIDDLNFLVKYGFASTSSALDDAANAVTNAANGSMTAADYYAWQQQQALNSLTSITTNAYTDLSSAGSAISSAALPLADAATSINQAGVGLVNASSAITDAGQAVAGLTERSIVAATQAAAAGAAAYTPGQRTIVSTPMGPVVSSPSSSQYAPGAVTATGLYTPPVSSNAVGAASQFNIPVNINGPISSLDAARDVANVMVQELRTILKV